MTELETFLEDQDDLTLDDESRAIACWLHDVSTCETETNDFFEKILLGDQQSLIQNLSMYFHHRYSNEGYAKTILKKITDRLVIVAEDKGRKAIKELRKVP